jgi:DNA-binding LacI/PurR family transcriptional regulator
MGKVTINDICREARVSLTTVSRVLNNQPGVGDETRKRVQALMKRLNFTPNAAARHLSRRQTETIGVIFPKFDTGFFSQFLQGVEQVTQPENFYILTVTSSGGPDPLEACLKLINEQRVDGLILFDPTLSAKSATELRKHAIPVIVADRRAKNLKMNSVAIDDFNGAYQATKHLIEHGYQRVATITGPLAWEDARERLSGYKKALQDHGIAVDEQLIVEGNFEREPSTTDFIKRFQNKPWPEAIFAANDEMALGLLKYVTQHRDESIRATAIVGFDDITLAGYVGLTTIHVSIGELGRKSAQLLLSLIRNKDAKNAPVQEIIPTQLVVRSTCGCMTSANKPQQGMGRLLQT